MKYHFLFSVVFIKIFCINSVMLSMEKIETNFNLKENLAENVLELQKLITGDEITYGTFGPISIIELLVFLQNLIEQENFFLLKIDLSKDQLIKIFQEADRYLPLNVIAFIITKFLFYSYNFDVKKLKHKVNELPEKFQRIIAKEFFLKVSPILNDFDKKNKKKYLKVNSNYGFTISELIDNNLVSDKIKETKLGEVKINLKNLKIESLIGLHNIFENDRENDRVNVLYLNNNQIYRLDRFTINSFENLRTLNLNNNSLQFLLSKNFYGLKNLEILLLSSNCIERIEFNAFDGLKKLRELYLDNNKLKYLEKEIFSGLENLEVLSLNSNRLKKILPKTFSKLTNLINLSLSQNSFEKIDITAFTGLKNLWNLWLDKNLLDNETINYINLYLPNVVLALE